MDFLQHATAYGLNIRHLISDGKWHRVPTTDKPRKRNGAYLFDGSKGVVRNWATMEGYAPWPEKGERPQMVDPLKLRMEREKHDREEAAKRHRASIIALSADAYPEVRVRCLDAGMDEVLSKPVLRHDLWAALAHWLPVVLAADKAAEPALQKAVDSGAVISLLKEILPLFAQGKADGIGRFKVLQELVAGSALASEVADAGLALKAYQFDLARQRLLRMASTNEWEVAL